MGLVIRRVQIDTIPASGEENLCTEAIRTIDVGEAIGFSGSGTVVIDARIVDGLGFDSSCKVTSERVASYHPEAFRKCVKLLSSRAIALPMTDQQDTSCIRISHTSSRLWPLLTV